MGGKYLLQVKNVTKRFPGVTALDGVNIEVGYGEILGLIGENGAGKSTLMKILVGVQQPDSGEILLHGERVRVQNPKHAAEVGIGMVFQEQSLLSNLSVAENLFIGHEHHIRRHGLIDWRTMNAKAREILAPLKVEVDPAKLLGELSLAERQMVEIARLLWLGEQSDKPSVIILDEPTTVLNQREIDILFETLRRLKSRASIIFISHRLDELIDLSDRVLVMRDGKDVARFDSRQVTLPELHRAMVGREVTTEYFQQDRMRPPGDEILLEVRGLAKKGHFEDVNLQVRAGEIVSLVGTLGSGKEEICRCIMGVSIPDSGTMHVKGQPFAPASPRDAVRRGIGYVPQDRRDEGLVLYLNVAPNISLPRLDFVAPRGILSRRLERSQAAHWVERLRIRTPSVDALCINLSGGNQQKVVLAKWLAAQVGLLILDHPTRGIDVGAKEEVYGILRELANQGIGMLLMSDTLEEDIGLAHRIVVLKDGRIVREFDSFGQGRPTTLDLIECMV